MPTKSINALFFILTQNFLALYRSCYAYECHTDTTKRPLCEGACVCVVWVCRWNFPLFTPQIWLKSKSSIIKLFPLDWCLLINYTTHNILITSIIVSDGSCSDKPKACQSLGPRTSNTAHSQLAPKAPVALRQYCHWFDWNPKGVPIENTLKGFLFINIQTCHLTP